MQNNKVPLESFQITKKLTKDISDYKEGTHLAHVECAKKMRADSIQANVGDFIQYIIVDGEGQDYQRAYNIQQVRDKNMKIDLNYYLTKQIIPPICRLIEPLDTITAPMIGECFGVEIKGGSNRSSGGNYSGDYADMDDEQEEEIQFENEAEKFATCDKLKLRCRHCGIELLYEGVLHPKTHKVGLKCYAKGGCPGYVLKDQRDADLAYYKNQIRKQFNDTIRKYYRRTFNCVGPLDPSKCPFQNRKHSIPLGSSRHCVCGGTVTESFSALKLNRQLDYYIYLFDTSKAETRFMQQQEDAKVEKPKTLKEKYEKEGLNLDDVDQLRRYVEKFKFGSTYARLETKEVFNRFVPTVAKESLV